MEAMSSFELSKKLSCRTKFSFLGVFEALADSFLCIGAGVNVEQPLIGFSILAHDHNLPFHCKHQDSP